MNKNDVVCVCFKRVGSETKKNKKKISNAFVNMSVANVEIRLFLYKVVHEVIAFKLTIITRCGSETNI